MALGRGGGVGSGGDKLSHRGVLVVVVTSSRTVKTSFWALAGARFALGHIENLCTRGFDAFGQRVAIGDYIDVTTMLQHGGTT